MTPDSNAIDPAGGTGDLLLYYTGRKTIWDIDESALKLCKFNYELNKQTNYELICKNSLLDFDDKEGTYSYVAINPPFGSSTIITDKTILDKFELGVGRKKQEIGILFIELGLKLLKEGGVMFVIVPAGYVGNGNKTCLEMRELLLRNRVIASIELPKNTFKRSGTGVNTYLLIIQKIVIGGGIHNIFISSINTIGYNLTKKDTPLKYKIIESTGEQMIDSANNPILDNDLEPCYFQISRFCVENDISGLNVESIDGDISYEFIQSNKLSKHILDVKRYLNAYIDVVLKLSSLGTTKVVDLGCVLNSTTKIQMHQKYRYIDIGEITTPFYSHKNLYGWELPSRAKYTLRKYDILVSKLEGNISYCVILDDATNYIATNGVAVIRPNNETSLYILLTNIMKKDFVIQHNAYLTGSIMASISDADIGEFLIDDQTIDIELTKKIVETLTQLHILRS
jgi:hypothetical protein